MFASHIVKPSLTLLTSEQIEEIHAYSLQILSTTGLRVDSDRARKLFAKAESTAIVKEDRVYIQPAMVEWALEKAPSTIDVYRRDGEPAFQLPEQARFGIGATDLYYADPESEKVLPFARRHMETAVRLADTLPALDVISTMGIIQDVPPPSADFYAALEMVANTQKPLILLVSDVKAFPLVLDLLEHLHGDLARCPSIIPYFNPITPLVINTDTVEKMRVAIERGLPILYSNYGMAGASTPITVSGELVLLNAELLAGLVLGQLMRPGTAMILGSLPACFDMKGKGTFYDMKNYLIDLACAEMMTHYGIPHVGTSGSGQGWGPGLITGGHQWVNHILSCLGKKGLSPFIGDTLDSVVFSPTIIVYANEVIEQARRLAEGFVLDNQAVGLDEIATIGPGGNFLMSDTTLALCNTAFYESAIFDHLDLDSWQALECPKAENVLREYTRRRIKDLAPPAYHADLFKQGDAFIRSLKIG